MEKVKLQEVLESLSPDERKIFPHLNKKSLKEIARSADVDETKALRALQFLSNKSIISITSKEKKIIDLGDNGVIYLKNSLPERKLLNLLAETKSLELENARKTAKLSENEFKVALGALKKKAMIELKQGSVFLVASMEEISKKSLEEQFLESLPLALESLTPEQQYALESLKSRKEIIEIKDEKEVSIEITGLGKEIVKEDLSKLNSLIESLTPELIQKGTWKGKKFRRYDIISPVPKIQGGKKHFVSQASEYAKKLWLEMGFKEMSGNLITTSFWNFDALFTAQDHPVREMQDTFFIKGIKASLPEAKLVKEVKKVHEGLGESKGWQYEWKEEDAKRVVLRTHTTCLSVKTLKKVSENKEF